MGFGYSNVITEGTYFLYRAIGCNNLQTRTAATFFRPVPALFPDCQIAAMVSRKASVALPPRCFCLRLLTGNVPQQQRHGHILQSRKFRQQVMELPNKAEFAVTKLGSAIIR